MKLKMQCPYCDWILQGDLQLGRHQVRRCVPDRDEYDGGCGRLFTVVVETVYVTKTAEVKDYKEATAQHNTLED